MCAKQPENNIFQPMRRTDYAYSLRALADHFRLFCPEAAVSLRQEAQKFDYDPAFGKPPSIPRQWIAYVDDECNLISIPKHESYRTNNNWKQIKVREVIE